MSYYDEITEWTNVFDIVVNRVNIINQTLGADCLGYRGSPVVIVYRKGLYVCKVCGANYATWRVYDLHSIRTALDRIDSLADGIWYLMRSGRLLYSQNVNQQTSYETCWYN